MWHVIRANFVFAGLRWCGRSSCHYSGGGGGVRNVGGRSSYIFTCSHALVYADVGVSDLHQHLREQMHVNMYMCIYGHCGRAKQTRVLFLKFLFDLYCSVGMMLFYVLYLFCLGTLVCHLGDGLLGFFLRCKQKKSLCVFVSLDPSEAQKLNKPVWDVVAEQMHIYIFIYIEMPTNSIVQYQM